LSDKETETEIFNPATGELLFRVTTCFPLVSEKMFENLCIPKGRVLLASNRLEIGFNKLLIKGKLIMS